MGRRGYDRRRVCAEEGCRESSITRYELKRDYADAVRREKDQPPYKCLKHAKPDEVLSVHNREIVFITEPSRQEFSRYRPGEVIGTYWGTSGMMYGPGFRAWAEDLPLGTQVVVTAQLIFPAGYEPPPSPDAPADPVPAARLIADADIVELDRELYVCQAEDYSRCDLIGPYRGPGAHHHCEYDEGHDEALHECACGYRWPNPKEN